MTGVPVPVGAASTSAPKAAPMTSSSLLPSMPVQPFAADGSIAGMSAAVWKFTEFNASFNLQYLQLQERAQVDSRTFTMLSNIMKGNHSDVKNAINNLR